MSQWNTWLHGSYRQARRVVITVVGFAVLALGIVLLVTPGPAFVVIPIGLGILAIEFAWPRRWLLKIKDKARDAADHWNGKGKHSRPSTGSTINNTDETRDSRMPVASPTTTESEMHSSQQKP